jgi:hypothetical protein
MILSPLIPYTLLPLIPYTVTCAFQQNCHAVHRPTLTELGLIAESFMKAKPADQHVYFAYFDFDASVQKVFQKVQCGAAWTRHVLCAACLL